MPIYSTRRSYRKRKVTSRRKPGRRKRSYQTKKIARISRAVTLAQCETKRYVILNEQFGKPATSGLNFAQWAYRNVFSGIPQGPFAYQRLGSEIQSPLISCNIRATVNWNEVASYNTSFTFFPVRCCLYLIALNDAIVSTPGLPDNYDYTSSSGSQIFYTADSLMPRLNGNNVKVLKKWSVLFNPPAYALVANSGPSSLAFSFGGIQTKCGKLRYKWKRKIGYEDTGIVPSIGGPASGGATRGWNYYLLGGWVGQANRGVSGTPAYPLGRILVDSFLYYKDP